MIITDGSAKFTVRKVVGEAPPIEVPVGVVSYFAGNNAPSGWLPCNGGAVSRTTYKALFSVIGTKYGAGDGSTTFNLPNLIGRFAEGGTSGTYKAAGLPNITGYFESGADTYTNTGYFGNFSGAFASVSTGGRNRISTNNNTTAQRVDFNASRSNGIFGKSNTVQPASLTLLPIIKY